MPDDEFDDSEDLAEAILDYHRSDKSMCLCELVDSLGAIDTIQVAELERLMPSRWEPLEEPDSSYERLFWQVLRDTIVHLALCILGSAAVALFIGWATLEFLR